MTTWSGAPCPVAIVDAHYDGARAAAACAVARSWASADTCEERAASIADVRPYRRGAFHERELPCILAVLALVRTPLRAVLVDGYVDLDEGGAPGLGAHLYASLGGVIAVVGVAKTAYGGGAFAAQVLRGASRRPLFVTARGLPVDRAAALVRAMHGAHRVPTLLARVDRLARDALRPGESGSSRASTAAPPCREPGARQDSRWASPSTASADRRHARPCEGRRRGGGTGMRIGIIGSGNIGGTCARLFTDAGHEVMLSHSGPPEALRGEIARLGARAHGGTVEEAARYGEVVLLAIPWRERASLPASALRGKIAIDAMNPYAPDRSVYDLGDSTSSEEVAKAIPGARLVKAFNTLFAKDLGSRGRRDLSLPERTVLFMAGDDEDAKGVVAGLIRDIGFAAVDTGLLREGGRMQQPGSPVYTRPLRAAEVPAALGIEPGAAGPFEPAQP